MFLEMTRKRNSELIRAATILHGQGKIPANTYVIDLDSLQHNVQAISETATDLGLNLYYMTKQIGRSGFVGQQIERCGIPKAVAVDIDEAIQLKQGNCKIGNIGHLVQPSQSQWKQILTNIRPEVITLFSSERAKQLSAVAEKLGHRQDVILRVIRPIDKVYLGQFGGFQLEKLEAELDEMLKLTGIQIAGITSFPVIELNQAKDDYVVTSNITTLQKARELLERKGITVKQVNAPSATSCHTLPMLKQYGVTHGEPGHGLTGTTPLHAYRADLREVPSIVYVSEISHMDDQSAYTIAGGFYARSNMQQALFGSNASDVLEQQAQVDQVSAANIDYYGSLTRHPKMEVGDTVIYAFRTQIFVTRAHIAYVQDLKAKQPKLVYFQRRGM